LNYTRKSGVATSGQPGEATAILSESPRRKIEDIGGLTQDARSDSWTRRVPNGRRVGAVGNRHWGALRHLDIEVLCVIRRPPRRRYLNDSHVIERAL